MKVDKKEGGKIYIDLYIFYVSFINYQMINIALALQKIKVSKKRKLWAAIIGAVLDSIFQIIKVYCINSTKDFLKNNFIRKGCLFGVAIGIVIVMTVILVKNKVLIQKIKVYVSLFVSAWILGGSMEWMLSEKFQKKIIILCIISWIISFVMQRLIVLYQSAMNMESGIVQVSIIMQGKKYTVRGLFDTGNHLYEPYKHRPVHIVETDVLEGLPDILNNKQYSCIYIPYQSLGKEDGLLPAICAEQLIIHKANREIVLKNQIIGLTKLSLSCHSQYQMLLHPDVISLNQEEGKMVC